MDLVIFDQFEKELSEFKERHESTVYDLTDAKQNKMARSDKHAIGKVVAALDKAHAAVKAPLLDQCRFIDNARNRIKDELRGIQLRIKEQIDAHEAIEAERIQTHKDNLDQLTGWEFFNRGTWLDHSLTDMKEALAVLDARVIDESWEEFMGEAVEARRQSIEKLSSWINQREKHDAEQAELAELREQAEAREKKEHEERIAREAAQRAIDDVAEKARQDKEAADIREQQLKEQAEKAEQARIDAVRRAEQAKEEADAEAKKQIKEEAARQAREAQERQANTEHVKAINKEVWVALNKNGVNADTAVLVVRLLAAGKIPHTSISY